MKKHFFSVFAVFACAAMLLSGCASGGTANAETVDREELDSEGNVVFVRPPRYVFFFGTSSVRDYVQVVAKQFSRNEAGQPSVRVTLRAVGKRHWYNMWSETPATIVLNGRCDFFAAAGNGKQFLPVYSTNRQLLVLKNGLDTTFEFVSPKKDAASFQLILSQEGK